MPYRGRHGTGPQHVGDLLPRFSGVTQTLDIQRVQHQTGRLESRVVTGDAVLIEQRALLGDGRLRRSRGRGRGGRGGLLQPGRMHVEIRGADQDNAEAD